MIVPDSTSLAESPDAVTRDLKSLFMRHARELRVYVTHQLRCAHTAADVVQDTFVRLAQQPSDAADSNPRAYLYRVAHNLAVDHHRRLERRATESTPHEAMSEIADETPAPERWIDGHRRVAALQRAMIELPVLTQQIFQLNRIEGLTYSEVAKRLGISESSVQKHLARAVQQAMRCMRDLGEE